MFIFIYYKKAIKGSGISVPKPSYGKKNQVLSKNHIRPKINGSMGYFDGINLLLKNEKCELTQQEFHMNFFNGPNMQICMSIEC